MSKARDIADGAANINLLDDVTAGTVAASKVIAADSNKDVASFRNVTLTGELDAATLDVSGNADIDGVLETDGLSINGTSVTATAAELNILDGVTSTAAELNILDGVTATAAELNYSDGVTSNIQTQLDAKQALDANLTSFVGVFTLPTSDGSADQVLKTNGSGTLSFADSGGGITNVSNVSMNGNSTVLFSSLPSGVSHIWVNVYNCSADGYSDSFTSIRLGTSSGLVTSGYSSGAAAERNGDHMKSSGSTDRLYFFYSEGQSNRVFNGSVHLAKLSNDYWVMSSMGSAEDTSAQQYSAGGRVDVGGTLTQLQVLLSGGGVTNWDQGFVNISYM